MLKTTRCIFACMFYEDANVNNIHGLSAQWKGFESDDR